MSTFLFLYYVTCLQEILRDFQNHILAYIPSISTCNTQNYVSFIEYLNKFYHLIDMIYHNFCLLLWAFDIIPIEYFLLFPKQWHLNSFVCVVPCYFKILTYEKWQLYSLISSNNEKKILYTREIVMCNCVGVN